MCPNIVTIDHVLKSAQENQALINGRWVPARSLGFSSFGYRLRAAWMVFTGHADALIWPGQERL